MKGIIQIRLYNVLLVNTVLVLDMCHTNRSLIVNKSRNAC